MRDVLDLQNRATWVTLAATSEERLSRLEQVNARPTLAEAAAMAAVDAARAAGAGSLVGDVCREIGQEVSRG